LLRWINTDMHELKKLDESLLADIPPFRRLAGP
jgi:hypothetical protein